ncbi:MAG: bacterio-opsin activator domain-containing protein, partial [Halobacteria archaeon]|nr:bacterio-opsin activator domain-containing protein [Halobacteria archaeon]
AVSETTGEVTVERTVPTADSFLQYFTAPDISEEEVRELAEEYDEVERVRKIGDGGGNEDEDGTFEIRYTDPPIVSTLATYGGKVRHMNVKRSDFYVMVELPPSTDMRSMINTLESELADIEVVAQRTTSGRKEDRGWRANAEDRLTEKQRGAMEAAYFAGYFERPRSSTGEEVAESLDVSPSTFRQHLRVGLRKTLSDLFGES